MNEAQKSVLQRHCKQLADDIMMTEELMANLYQRKIFERNMIEMIKAEKTPTEQIYKMLSMLPKRGPDAFDHFVDIIKTDYPWLAAMLEVNLKSEQDNTSLSRQNTVTNLTCTCGNNKSEQLIDGMTPRELPADSDIKTKVSTFIHKQFGQSKRISQLDKKAMEKWLSDQLQTERKSSIIKKATEEDVTDSMVSPSPDLSLSDLKKVFNKVRDENVSDLLNSEHANKHLDNADSVLGSDEIDGLSDRHDETMAKTVSKLDSEIDKLINRMNHMEGLITQCHYILGDPDRKRNLPGLVKDIKYESKQMEKDLGKEKEKSEKMLNELYDYCKSINKLENVRQQQRNEVDKLNHEVEDLKRENAAIQMKCKTLEEANLRHLEKEKTLQNLRKMVDDLKSSHTNLADENANYRINYGAGKSNRKLGRNNANSLRRGSTVESVGTNNSVRKTGSKPMLYTNSRRIKPIMSRYQ
ncbi:hypothetical protein ACF0H5_022722 [Mactra antiquata]